MAKGIDEESKLEEQKIDEQAGTQEGDTKTEKQVSVEEMEENNRK